MAQGVIKNKMGSRSAKSLLSSYRLAVHEAQKDG